MTTLKKKYKHNLFVYNEGNLDHGIVYMNGDRVDWTINEWKNVLQHTQKDHILSWQKI